MCELEYTFIQVFNSQKNHVITRSIYKHPSTDFDEFNNNFLNKNAESKTKYVIKNRIHLF